MSNPPLPVGYRRASSSTAAGSEAPPVGQRGLFLAQSVSRGGSPRVLILTEQPAAPRACQHCLLNPHGSKSQSSSSSLYRDQQGRTWLWGRAGGGHILTSSPHSATPPLPSSPLQGALPKAVTQLRAQLVPAHRSGNAESRRAPSHEQLPRGTPGSPGL